MKLLVLTSEPIIAESLRDVLGPEARDAEVMVVAPALHSSRLRFWLSDADEAIAKADAVWRETVENLSDAGVPAAGDTGESDPLEAVEDALREFDADKIVVFTHPEGMQRYREEADEQELERRFGRPVERALVPSSSG
jgi:nucleotide-binding universal stress UspA family protein